MCLKQGSCTYSLSSFLANRNKQRDCQIYSHRSAFDHYLLPWHWCCRQLAPTMIPPLTAWSTTAPKLQPPARSTNDGNTDSNQVNYGGQVYTLSAGLEEVFRPDDNHSSSQLNISNGEFYSVQVTLMGQLDLIWRARNASVWLYVNMYSPGTAALSGGTFSFAPRNTDEDDPALARNLVFQERKIRH